jgi:tryptophan 2,3-dioxygenase
VEAWLERTPFLSLKGFDFIKNYQKAVSKMLKNERTAIEKSLYLNDDEKALRLKMLGSTGTYFQFVFDPSVHAALCADGKLKLSYKATIAALLITLYHDEPILNQPFTLLQRLITLDENLTTWRIRHAQMVQRMLGRKIGTGGSSGYDYLAATAAKHPIFSDFHNLSTLLIPRSELPPLPSSFRRELGFFFSEK